MTASAERPGLETGDQRPWWATTAAASCWLVAGFLLEAFPTAMTAVLFLVATGDFMGQGPSTGAGAVFLLLLLVGLALPFIGFFGARRARLGQLVAGLGASAGFLVAFVIVFIL